MSRLDDLLAELCPNGVEFRHMWELTTWDKKFQGIESFKQPRFIKYNYLLANDLKKLATDIGNVKLLNTGINNFGVTTEELAGENICEGEIIALPWGSSSPWVQYYKGKFVTADNRIAVVNDAQVLNTRFLYYWMINNIKIICSFYRGSGIQHPSMASVLDMFIPVPPLPIQQEIVRILDKFTELEARKKQYEYYCNRLLMFDDSVQRVPLSSTAIHPQRFLKSSWRTQTPVLLSQPYKSSINLLKNIKGIVFLDSMSS